MGHLVVTGVSWTKRDANTSFLDEYNTLDGLGVPELEKTTPFGFSVLLYSEFASFMKKDALSHFPYRDLFQEQGLPTGVFDFNGPWGPTVMTQCSHARRAMKWPIHGLARPGRVDQVVRTQFQIKAEEEGKPLNPWGDISVFTEKNTMAVVTLPHACHADRREQIDPTSGIACWTFTKTGMCPN